MPEVVLRQGGCWRRLAFFGLLALTSSRGTCDQQRCLQPGNGQILRPQVKAIPLDFFFAKQHFSSVCAPGELGARVSLGPNSSPAVPRLPCPRRQQHLTVPCCCACMCGPNSTDVLCDMPWPPAPSHWCPRSACWAALPAVCFCRGFIPRTLPLLPLEMQQLCRLPCREHHQSGMQEAS